MTPASAARLNKFGNLTPGQRNQIVSALRAQNNPLNNATPASKKRNRRRAQYFVPRLDSKLSPGVWMRTSRRGKIRKVLHFSEKQSVYQKRLDFDVVVARTASDVFPEHFRRWMKEALATAK